ncbi:MAG: C40 family peptidase [Pseudarcicella sp.]|jgi:cell wall-associated NlpC family hydrolase|nr:C40 family peptidase [Pseudarcicella sp.]
MSINLTYKFSKINSAIITMLLFTFTSCSIFRKREKVVYQPPPSKTYKKPNNTPSSTTAKKVIYNTVMVNSLLATAKSYLGVPYKSGGTDANGMDCSGLIYTTFKQQGINLPRISWQQASVGKEIPLKDSKPGDLVFFITSKNKAGNINHAGIISDIKSDKEILFVHASSSKGIREDDIFNKYWYPCFVKVMRPF